MNSYKKRGLKDALFNNCTGSLRYSNIVNVPSVLCCSIFSLGDSARCNWNKAAALTQGTYFRDNVIQIRCHPHSGVSKYRCLRFGFPRRNGSLGPRQSGSNEGYTQASVAAWTESVDQRSWVSGTISWHAMVQIPQKSRGQHYLGRYISIICKSDVACQRNACSGDVLREKYRR